MEPLRIPHVGMRTFKTALATALCALVYYFVGRSPAFACIGVIFGMGYDLQDAKKNGGNRLFGTIIGGIVGVVLFKFYLQGAGKTGGRFLLEHGNRQGI